MKRIAALALVIVITAVVAPSAGAHAVLVSSVPRENAVLKTTPKQAVLHFNSRIEKRVTEVTLLDAGGRKIALPGGSRGSTAGPADQLIVPLPQLRPGSYRLQYQVLATDGHLSPGQIHFTIARGKAP